MPNTLRPPQVIWAYWREVLNITEYDFLADPCYIGIPENKEVPMATWKYEIETRDGYLSTILVHVVEGREKVTLTISSVRIKKVA